MENKGNWYLDFVILVISQKIGDAPTVLISTVSYSISFVCGNPSTLQVHGINEHESIW
jgi:hypothetical protein